VRRDEALRNQEEIRTLYSLGRSLRSEDIVLVLFRNGSDRCRTLVVASRKVGCAVRRNRAKRLLREAHRRLRPGGEFAGMDLALIARAGACGRTAQTIQRQLEELYRQAHILERAPESSGEKAHSS
jgi:ribonuclease P protein component